MKTRHWCPGYSLTEEPLRWKAPCAFFVGLESGVPDKTLCQVFAVIALCPQHTFSILTGDADRVRTALGEVITPQTAPGAQTGDTQIEQYTDAFIESWQYRAGNEVGPMASEFTDSHYDYGGSQSRREYHKLIDGYFKRHREWWPLPNVTVEEDAE